MTAVHDQAADAVEDFTSSAEPVRFRVNGEDFEAVAELPVFTALELADRLTTLDDPDAPLDDRAEVIRELLRALLVPESAARFDARLSDRARPIGAVTFQRVLSWLLARYGAGSTSTTPPVTPEVDRG